jgi:hypothetical protein
MLAIAADMLFAHSVIRWLPSPIWVDRGGPFISSLCCRFALWAGSLAATPVASALLAGRPAEFASKPGRL